MTTDITEKKQMEERLLQAEKMEAIGTLAGGIAHDFNNILFPLIGFAEMLKDDLPADASMHENVDEILKAALRAKDLVRQILTFSRQTNHDVTVIKLQPVIKEAIKLLRSSIPQTIQIDLDIDHACGMVLADQIQIHQIIMNLVTNAYHALDMTGGTIKVSLSETKIEPDNTIGLQLASGEKYAHLVFTDSGKGISKENIDRVFDPYFTTKEEGKGTGLGLSIVHGIVAASGGAIKIDSEPEKGTNVHVYLPVFERLQEQISGVTDDGEITGGTERILLVDDETAILKIVSKQLERLGYRITAFDKSTSAVEAFRKAPDMFDVVITDMTMPELTGIQVSKEIKKIAPNTPVVIFTGFSDKIDSEKCRLLGINGYIMKPVVKHDIAAIIRKVLDNQG
ncbi:MAG: response regulator [Proteobacteria bacterium]|nr:response regulator [Pseudomonadota bacterium]